MKEVRIGDTVVYHYGVPGNVIHLDAIVTVVHGGHTTAVNLRAFLDNAPIRRTSVPFGTGPGQWSWPE